MAGLVPAIRVLLAEALQERRGCPRQSPDQVRGRAWRRRDSISSGRAAAEGSSSPFRAPAFVLPACRLPSMPAAIR